MFKAKSFNLDKNGFDYRSNKQEKWDKKLNKFFGFIFILFCILLFLAIINANILNYFVNGEDHTTTVSTSYAFDDYKSVKANPSCSMRPGCNILCESINEIYITPSIIQLIQEHNCNEISKLEIDNCEFVNNRMRIGWFNVTINVTALELRRGNLNDIEENSFNVSAFKLTSNVRIYSLGVTKLKKETFEGFASVATFSLTKLPLESIAYDFLYPMRFSLSSLEIQDINKPIYLKNITGASVLSKLEILDLRQNTFVDSTISYDAFTGVKGVQSIYMSKTSLVSLNRYAFYEIRDLVKLIDLRDNRISTVPNDVFSTVVDRCTNLSSTCGIRIELDGNPWNCNCNLLNLQSVMRLHANKFRGNPLCSLPLKLRDVPIVNVVDLCEENSATTSPIDVTTPNTDINVTAPTDPEQRLVTVKCLNMKITVQKSYKQVNTEPYEFRSNENEFRIIDVKPGTVNIEVTAACDDYLLLWFDKTADVRNQTTIETSNDVNCLVNFGKNITVNNLAIDNTYTFCLCSKSETTVSPFNCLSYYAKSNKGKTEAWLYEDVKLMTITVMIAVLIGCILCGAGFFYLLAKRNPTMILDRKQLNQLNNGMNRRGNAVNGNFFENRGPNAINFAPNLANGYEESHYMDGDELKSRMSYRRTNSEGSICSAQSYISAIVPPNKYYNKNRKSDFNNETKPSTIYMEKYPSEPPPLPPPNRRSEQSISSNEPLCTVNMLIEPYGYTKSFA